LTAKVILKKNNNQPNKNREGPSDRRCHASPSSPLLPLPPPPLPPPLPLSLSSSMEMPSRAIILSTFRTRARRSLARRPGNRRRTGDVDGGNNNSDSGGEGGAVAGTDNNQLKAAMAVVLTMTATRRWQR